MVRARRGGRATSTLKQEDWNKRLAWPRAQEGKSPKRVGGGKGTEKKPVGAGLRLLDAGSRIQSPLRAHHLPRVSGRTQPPFRGGIRGSSLLPPFLPLQRASPLLLHLPLFLCSLTSTPSASVSPTVRTSFVSTSRSFVLDSPVDVICDLTSRNMRQGQLVTTRRTGKLILLSRRSTLIIYQAKSRERLNTKFTRIPFKR